MVPVQPVPLTGRAWYTTRSPGGPRCFRRWWGRPDSPFWLDKGWNVASPVVEFTTAERNLIRTEFMVRFGSARRLAEGIMLRRWATGPCKGQVKLSKTVQSLLDRGLVEIVDDGKAWPVALFTLTGYAALHLMGKDARHLDPERFGHVLAELTDGAGGDLTHLNAAE